MTSRKLRVVLDTNVLISALGHRGEGTRKVWDLVEEGRFELFVSPFILEEFERNLPAKADILVTGNMRHIRPLGVFRGTAILTPREFLDKYFPTA